MNVCLYFPGQIFSNSFVLKCERERFPLFVQGVIASRLERSWPFSVTSVHRSNIGNIYIPEDPFFGNTRKSPRHEIFLLYKIEPIAICQRHRQRVAPRSTGTDTDRPRMFYDIFDKNFLNIIPFGNTVSNYSCKYCVLQLQCSLLGNTVSP